MKKYYAAINTWVLGGFDGSRDAFKCIDSAAEFGVDGVELTVGDVVPVTADECSQVFFRTFFRMKITCFRPEKHAESVAGFHESRGRRIVGGTDHIGAHFFKDFNIFFMGAIRQCSAETAEIVVQIAAPELKMTPVEEKAFIRSEFKITDAE